MDKNFSFIYYNSNFNHKMTDKNERLNAHINLLFNELKDIKIAIYFFNTVDKEWDRRIQEKEVTDYSVIRTTLYESLVFKVFLGLNKIFPAVFQSIYITPLRATVSISMSLRMLQG